MPIDGIFNFYPSSNSISQSKQVLHTQLTASSQLDIKAKSNSCLLVSLATLNSISSPSGFFIIHLIDFIPVISSTISFLVSLSGATFFNSSPTILVYVPSGSSHSFKLNKLSAIKSSFGLYLGSKESTTFGAPLTNSGLSPSGGITILGFLNDNL
nr:MAG TPA: hypothetical protein [Caudoviricetes sp.]